MCAAHSRILCVGDVCRICVRREWTHKYTQYKGITVSVCVCVWMSKRSTERVLMQWNEREMAGEWCNFLRTKLWICVVQMTLLLCEAHHKVLYKERPSQQQCFGMYFNYELFTRLYSHCFNNIRIHIRSHITVSNKQHCHLLCNWIAVGVCACVCGLFFLAKRCCLLLPILLPTS